MGHVDLAAPVSHIWFFKGVPSRIGYLIDMAPKELEKVLYFAASIVTWVDDEAREKDVPKLEKEVEKILDAYEAEKQQQVQELRESLDRRVKYLSSGSQSGFSDDDLLWVDALDINLKKLADDEREKLEKELKQDLRVRHRRHRGLHRGRDRADEAGLGAVPGDEAEGRHRRRDPLPRAQGPLRIPVRLRRVLPRRHGRRGGARPARAGRPRGRARSSSRTRSRPPRARSRAVRSSA